jgi:hypothetical protein
VQASEWLQEVEGLLCYLQEAEDPAEFSVANLQLYRGLASWHICKPFSYKLVHAWHQAKSQARAEHALYARELMYGSCASYSASGNEEVEDAIQCSKHRGEVYARGRTDGEGCRCPGPHRPWA